MATVRTNLCKYPSFEDGTELATGWTQYTQSGATSTYTIEHDPASLGTTHSQGWVVSATGSNKAGYIIASTGYSPDATFVEGDYCVVSAYVKGALSGCTMAFGIRWLASASLLNEEISDAFEPSGDWQRFSFVSGAAPATTNQVQIRIYIQSLHSGDTADVNIDCCMIENASVLTDYFDGDTADTAEHVYAWTGTANASHSTDTYTEATSTCPINLLRPRFIPSLGGH